MQYDVTLYVGAAQKGDRDALASLLTLSQDRIFRFCFYLSGSLTTSEDLAQDVLIRTFENLKQLERPQDFFPWMFRIARNLWIDLCRSKKNQKMEEYQEDQQANAREAWKPESGVSLEALELQLEIEKGLKDLSSEDRWILLLVELEDYSYQEAAEAVGISESALKSRIYRIRQGFLQKMQNA